MIKKRYAIVRVQKKCPYYEVISKKCLLDFEDCRKECINIKGKFQYGDTKKQLIKKVAQVLIKDEMKYCKWETKVHKEVCWQNNMELAKEIVEFLGVEE